MGAAFTGEFHHSLDIKGRAIVPSKYRETKETEFIVTRSLDGCLSLYRSLEWQCLEEKLSSLPMTDKRARTLKRYLLGSAAVCEIDRQGRILIPEVLRSKAGIEKDIVFLGVGDHAEIWSEESFSREVNIDEDELCTMWEGLGI